VRQKPPIPWCYRDITVCTLAEPNRLIITAAASGPRCELYEISDEGSPEEDRPRKDGPRQF